jgi:hypothetical protein
MRVLFSNEYHAESVIIKRMTWSGFLILELFNSNPYTIAGFDRMSFWNVDIKPESIRGLLSWVLGHQAILEFIDVRNEFNFSFKFQNFGHNKKKK